MFVGVANPRAGKEATANLKGKEKEKADITFGSVPGGENRNWSMANGRTLDKGKEKGSIRYVHQTPASHIFTARYQLS